MKTLSRRQFGALFAACSLALALPVAQAQHQAPGAAKKRPPPLAMGAAFAPGGELWIAALDEHKHLFVQTSADEGRSWSPPRRLDTGSDTIVADGENRPKLAFGPQGRVVIAYTEPLAKPYTGRIRMLRSDDGGRSFSAPFTVHRDPQIITHRFESVGFDAQGTLHTVWIDKRDLEARIEAAARAAPAAPAASAASGAGHRHKPKVDYRGAAIYRNESRDGGQTFGPDIKLADHSCECCRIALAPTPEGSLAALWRHVYAPNERDHGFAVLSAPPRAEPVRATLDHWAIDACPHHGPGLTPAAGGGYHAVWFGIRDGQAAVRYGQLAGDGTPRGEVRPLPDESAEHAAVASAGNVVAISWRSFDGQATRWRAWVSQDDGRSFALRELGRSSDDNDHPLLARRGPQILALWRTTQGVRVERLVP
ncbi:conserved exported hypothetical protein [Rubrivivax sp. A210]|uniref:sialidase family protein n=1 Tax=Rubrivivax sp. A210 TaxID=2772301 RepID=UPI00199E4D1A|nr:sialidase family protein [Rubrivivax sp. A210]CAD5373827.1 conserved exported hypothetical protein [Rubrivivax sp. A210]